MSWRRRTRRRKRIENRRPGWLNYIHYKVWGEITCPLLNFNDAGSGDDRQLATHGFLSYWRVHIPTATTLYDTWNKSQHGHPWLYSAPVAPTMTCFWSHIPYKTDFYYVVIDTCCDNVWYKTHYQTSTDAKNVMPQIKNTKICVRFTLF